MNFQLYKLYKPSFTRTELLSLHCKRSVSILSEINMFTSDYYSLSLLKKGRTTLLGMQVHSHIINTRDIPYTYEFLALRLPSVLRTHCFNELNLPFDLEVKNTELGHLFEHILLDKLCELKLKSGRKSASFTGRTDWNWERDPYGFFYITVEMKKSDYKFLEKALMDTITLFNSLLRFSEAKFQNTKLLLSAESMDSTPTAHRLSSALQTEY